jgi:hypothetical protein
MGFWEKISPETRKASDDFIEEIKQNFIKKRILPNYSEDYPDEKAFDSFTNISKSEIIDEIMIKAYDRSNK